MVPESHITHVFALCDQGCAGKYGDTANGHADPDYVFRANLAEAQATHASLADAARDWDLRRSRAA